MRIALSAIQRDGNKEVIGVVADEIDDSDAVFLGELAQASTKLLGEHDAGLGVA